MKIGTKVYYKDMIVEYVGYIAQIEEVGEYPYIVVRDKEDLGKTFMELYYKYGNDTYDFGMFNLEELAEYDTYIKEKRNDK